MSMFLLVLPGFLVAVDRGGAGWKVNKLTAVSYKVSLSNKEIYNGILSNCSNSKFHRSANDE